MPILTMEKSSRAANVLGIPTKLIPLRLPPHLSLDEPNSQSHLDLVSIIFHIVGYLDMLFTLKWPASHLKNK